MNCVSVRLLSLSILIKMLSEKVYHYSEMLATDNEESSSVYHKPGR
jgi:hypothetical protein